MSRRLFFFSATLLLVSTANAQRAPFTIPDPDPEVERKSFIVADGFEVNLFAADPILAKPLQMNFDPRGRLWVSSSEVYPQISPGQTANDKVLILEDTDGDGKADKTTVFADGLLIPTGIEPGDGGAYVANSTELIHLKDTDGDGKADKRRVVLSGFGTEDTHHILHTLRWGYDGQLYFNQSIYIHSHIETPHGVRRLGGGGIWSLRPETMELDVFIRGLVNPWGHHFDRWGQSFATDGAGGEGINYCLPGAYYFTAPDAVRVLPGLNPGSPKDCGLEVASGRHLPESWQGSLLTNDFRGNRVVRYVVSDDGAGFASREQPELIKTRHVAFRPIDVKMGPDGAIYIADWYNPIIQHGEVDFRDPRRDHTRGRIWRVTAKGRPLVEKPKLVGASVIELLDALKSPEDWTRQQAKRVLKERGAKEVVPVLASWVRAIDDKDPDAEHQRLEALWTYQSLDVVQAPLLVRLLRSPDARVRTAATRVVSYWHDRLEYPLGLLLPQVNDDNPRVRLEAVRALARLPGAGSAGVAMKALDRPVDRFLDYALWLTARDLQGYWLPEVRAGKSVFGANASHLVFALQAVGSLDVVKPLLDALKTGTIGQDREESVLSLAATLGQPADLGMILEMAATGDEMNAARRAVLLDGLIKAQRQRKARPEGDLNRILPLFDAKSDPLVIATAHAAGAWKLETAIGRLDRLARARDSSDAVQGAAVEALAEIGSPAARKAVDQLTRSESARPARIAALAAMAATDPKLAAERAAGWLMDSGETNLAEAIVTQFSRVKNGPAALAVALEGKTIAPDAAKLALRAGRALGREDASLSAALRKAAGLGAGPKAFAPEEKLALLAEVLSKGDPARGEAVFRRKDSQCLKCHAVAGAGGQVGPSLESIGASAPIDYLLESLIEPNKAIKENYHSIVVATTDGQVVSGIKVRQSDRELVLRDAEDREISIPLGSIEEQRPSGSLMPVGLTETMTRSELVDLTRFLSELGKIGPYSLSKARMVRRWRVLEVNAASHTELRRWGLGAAAKAGNSYGDQPNPSGLIWSPAYSDVSGLLPLAELPVIKIGAMPGSGAEVGEVGFARVEIDVTTPGKISVAINSTSGLSLWVDGRTVEPRMALNMDLTTGIHVLTFAFRLGERKEGLSVTLEDAPGSSAKAQPVVGK